jgi:hypothetical protein
VQLFERTYKDPNNQARRPRGPTSNKVRLCGGLESLLDAILLHRIPVRIYLVDLARIQFVDAGFNLVHIAGEHSNQMIGQDELFGDLIGRLRR